MVHDGNHGDPCCAPGKQSVGENSS